MKSTGPMPSLRNERRIRLAAIGVQLLCCALIAPLVYAGFYAHPAGADDYRFAVWDGFFSGMAYLYQTAGGRYFSAACAMLNPLHWHSIAGDRYACLALLLGFVASFYSLIRQALLRYSTMPGPVAGAVAAAAIVVMLNGMSEPDESFFWYTGAVTYTLPAILLAWLLQLMMRLKPRPGRWQRIGACLLCLAIAGGNELTALLLLALCFGGWMYGRRQGQASRARFFGVLLLLCAAGLVISTAAPGNYLRLGTQTRELFMVLPDWIYFTQRFLYRWITDPFLLFLSAGVVWVGWRYPLQRAAMNLLAAFLLPLAMAYLLFLPGNLSLGALYYPRIVSTIYFFFVLGWLVFLMHLSAAMRHLSTAGSGSSRRWMRGICMVIMLAGLLSVGRSYRHEYVLLMTCRGLAKRVPQRYSAELEARYHMIRAGGDTVLVPPLTTKEDNPLYFLDISTDPANMQNQRYAEWWGKKAIALTKFR
jgi:hypothetical protein